MPAVPDGAKQPQDHAAKAEALGETIAVTYNGVTYQVDSDAFKDIVVLDLIAEMQAADGASAVRPLKALVQNILGDEQWDTFVSVNTNDRGRFSVEHLSGLFKKLDDAAGNSAASSGS